MSPAALALAVGLHVLAAAALWWAAPLRPFDHAETPIMVSVEPEPLSGGLAAAPGPAVTETTPAEPVQSEAKQPADAAPVAAQPPPEPVQQAALAPAQPMPVERPPEPPPRQVTAPAPLATTAVPTPPTENAEPSPAPPPPREQEVAEPAPAPASEAEAEAAWQTDASSWKPQVTLEQSTPPPRPIRQAPRPPSTPRTAQTPGARLQDYPPQTSSLGGPSTSSVDSALGDGGARNDYLSRVYRHVDPYRDYPAAARAARQHGRVVTRVTISRAGELLDIRLDRSSGWPLIDSAEMAAIRRAMPLPPVPDGMRGDPVVLVLPMNY